MFVCVCEFQGAVGKNDHSNVALCVCDDDYNNDDDDDDHWIGSISIGKVVCCHKTSEEESEWKRKWSQCLSSNDRFEIW